MLNMLHMLKTISILVYISFIHTVYIGKLNPYFKKEAGNLLAAATAAMPLATAAMPLATAATENITKVRPMRGKQCNFKCDCFFSHSVKNDNICVPIWIRPLGL
jgi:hypothetical protein